MVNSVPVFPELCVPSPWSPVQFYVDTNWTVYIPDFHERHTAHIKQDPEVKLEFTSNLGT